MKKTGSTCKFISILSSFILMAVFVNASLAGSKDMLSGGQTVYVPIYSHIYSGLKGRPFRLAATLSIRNTDPKHPIMLVSVKFYDSNGRLLKEYLNSPSELKAMTSTRYILTYESVTPNWTVSHSIWK
ncbi:MAG: DUF3124 domain-containing protein [Calditrichia bacterium]